MQRRDTGRPEYVFGRLYRVWQLEHEILLTDFVLLFPNDEFTRDARVGNTKADGLLIREGRKCYVEIDNHTMSAKRMRLKWQRYGNAAEFILVVALTDARADRLRRGAEIVKDYALFSTFDRIRAGLPWVDWCGNTVTI